MGRERRSLGPWIIGIAGALALALGLTSLTISTTSSDPSVKVLSTTSTRDVPTTGKSIVSVPRTRPMMLTIPAIGLSTRLGTLGLQSDGQVQVPATASEAGWYVDGASPGQVGSAVILGHVDSFRGPGVFFELKTLKAGDVVDVTLANGTLTRFVVTRVVQYAKSNFPDRLVYGSNGTRALQLVTCGGTFDAVTGHYESNVVVFSQLESVQRATT